ncbi:hypothetical protein IV203_006556 [Nitzschia inconspicua]|uniref:Uncharacterized protein n=1 Tax=Nitzschia inconspicua TaxID=303405 RepID=A0A9K3PAD5_9STRA|nr:hypothetical protein IV203_006556 [Nitzschia inconspicua]
MRVTTTTTAAVFWIYCSLVVGCLVTPFVSGQDVSDPPASAPSLQPISVDSDSPGAAETTTTGPTIAGWQGCIDPNGGFPQLVTIGEPTTVCLVLSSSPDWGTSMNYLRLNFRPIADDYSRFHVPNSFQQLIMSQDNALSTSFPGNITVHVSSQTALSFQKRYFDGFEKVFPYLTAIINVEGGTVTGITWDDACLFCSANDCEPNTFDFSGNLATKDEARQPVGGCGVLTDNCRSQVTTGDEQADGCDLLLYVVWTGTDSRGRDFRSSAYRFSAFPAQKWTNRISQVLPDFVPQSTEDLQELNPIN